MLSNFKEILEKSISLAGSELIKLYLPIFGPIIGGIIVVFFIKLFARKIIYLYSIITGATKKERKQYTNIVENAIDLVSTINDMNKK